MVAMFTVAGMLTSGGHKMKQLDQSDSDNFYLAEENRLLRAERQALATRLRGIAESVTTQEPSRDCVASLIRLAKELESPPAVDAVARAFEATYEPFD